VVTPPEKVYLSVLPAYSPNPEILALHLGCVYASPLFTGSLFNTGASVSSCLPTLRPLDFLFWFRSFFSSLDGSSPTALSTILLLVSFLHSSLHNFFPTDTLPPVFFFSFFGQVCGRSFVYIPPPFVANSANIPPPFFFRDSVVRLYICVYWTPFPSFGFAPELVPPVFSLERHPVRVLPRMFQSPFVRLPPSPPTFFFSFFIPLLRWPAPQPIRAFSNRTPFLLLSPRFFVFF